jgi:hypothetical protein
MWLDKISNEELWQRTKQTPIEQQIKERKSCWIGHTLCKPEDAIETHALNWNPQGTRNRGRPRTTRKRTRERELQKVRISWREAQGLALDRTKSKSFTKALCST